MLLLVRHGRTAANAEQRLQGRMDLPLDEVGEAQVQSLAEWIGTPDRVISSPLRRATQTAEAFGMPYEIDDRFIELDYGSLDGCTWSEVGTEVWDRWHADPGYRPGGGESLEALRDRVVPAVEQLVKEAVGRTIAVTTHVSPIKAAVTWALDVDVRVGWRCHLDHASVCRITMSSRGPVLIGFNETRR